MTQKKSFWATQRRNGKWAVEKTGTNRASSLFNTQEQAWKEARKLARRDGTEAFLKGKDGKIRARNTYGCDPYPLKG